MRSATHVKFGWLLLGLSYGVAIATLPAVFAWQMNPRLALGILLGGAMAGMMTGGIVDSAVQRRPTFGDWFWFVATAALVALVLLLLPAFSHTRE